MKKTISALALIAAVALGTIGLTVGTASAHDANSTYDCFTVTTNFTNFAVGTPPGSSLNTATVTVNGAETDFSWPGKDFTAEVPFVSHSGDPDVVVVVAWHGLDGNVGSETHTFPADDCAPPTTPTTVPTAPTTIPTNVSPAVVTRPAAAPAVAAEAVVASPAFTG